MQLVANEAKINAAYEMYSEKRGIVLATLEAQAAAVGRSALCAGRGTKGRVNFGNFS